ncbi:MAG: hypothetical protein IPH44_36015 [Myxococcales bacterium]|nr:hypothetical protein [Myxococcales bacterium]
MIKRGSGGGLIAVCGLLAAMGCGDDQHVTTLQWYRRPCTGVFPQLCPVEIAPMGQPGFIYDSIQDYQLTWGVEADVRYHIEPGPGGEDAGDYWVVDTVLAERTVPPGTAITWTLRAGEDWAVAVGDHVEVLGEPVACEPTLCAELTSQAGRLVDVEYTGDAAMPLRAVAVRPAP